MLPLMNSRRHAPAAGGGAPPLPEVGLCSVCAQARRQDTARGAVFWRCAAADSDASLLRYPPLPVTRCPAYRPGSEPEES